MSERLNSVDIEDVLSSIRRLVSDDMRPAAKAAPQPATPTEPQADKLILTPALRIAPEQDDAALSLQDMAAPAPLHPVTPEPVMSFHSVRPERGAARLEAVMGQVARGLDAGPGDWEAAAEPPARFESDWADPDLQVKSASSVPSVDMAAPLDLRDPLMGNATEAPFVDVDTDFQSAALTLVDLVPVAETISSPDVESGTVWRDDVNDESSTVTSDLTMDALAEEWPVQDWAAPGEPDLMLGRATQDAPDGAGWPEPEAAVIDSQPVAMAEEPAMTDKDEPADLPAADLPDWARMESDPVDTASADLEMPVPPASVGRQGSTDPRWADAAEAEIRRELEEEVTASAFARFADDDLDDRPFDEDMLRDLVRDIIREELQGALGERITRNVRKLVRAEIARALAVRDFE